MNINYQFRMILFTLSLLPSISFCYEFRGNFHPNSTMILDDHTYGQNCSRKERELKYGAINICNRNDMALGDWSMSNCDEGDISATDGKGHSHLLHVEGYFTCKEATTLNQLQTIIRMFWVQKGDLNSEENLRNKLLTEFKKTDDPKFKAEIRAALFMLNKNQPMQAAGLSTKTFSAAQ